MVPCGVAGSCSVGSYTRSPTCPPIGCYRTTGIYLFYLLLKHSCSKCRQQFRHGQQFRTGGRIRTSVNGFGDRYPRPLDDTRVFKCMKTLLTFLLTLCLFWGHTEPISAQAVPVNLKLGVNHTRAWHHRRYQRIQRCRLRRQHHALRTFKRKAS